MFRLINIYKTIIIGYSLVLLGIVLVTIPLIGHFGENAKFVFQTIGTALLPTGLISLINDYFLKKDFSKELNEQLEDFINDKTDQIIERQLHHATVKESNPTQEISELLAASKKRIFLMNNWIPDFDGIRPGLKIACSNPVTIKILLMNPESKFAALRAKELGIMSDSDLGTYMRIDIQNIVEFFEKNNAGNKLELRLYDSMPAMPSYANESTMYVGWFFKGKKAVNCPVAKITNPLSPLYKEVEHTFEFLWNKSDTVIYYPKTA